MNVLSATDLKNIDTWVSENAMLLLFEVEDLLAEIIDSDLISKIQILDVSALSHSQIGDSVAVSRLQTSLLIEIQMLVNLCIIFDDLSLEGFEDSSVKDMTEKISVKMRVSVNYFHSPNMVTHHFIEQLVLDKV